MSDIHLRLRQIRRAKNLSQEELAERLGISRQAVIALERGTSLPSLPVLLALMRVLELPFPRLFGEAWQPFKKFDSEDDETTDLSFQSGYQPAVRLTVAEDDRAVTVWAELPGVDEQDVTVDLGQHHFLILATRKPIAGARHRHIEEIETGPLARIVSLPCPIDPQKATAAFENGVLELVAPKLVPDAKRRITFKPGGASSRPRR